MRNNKYYIFIAILTLSIIFGGTNFVLANNTKYITKKPTVKTKVIVKENTVTLDVLGNTYKVSIKNKDTVYDAMSNLANKKDSNFSFHSKNYSGLGNFIDEINGIKGTPGHYWIYYINNKKASVGVSKYFVKNGDTIKWNQEVI